MQFLIPLVHHSINLNAGTIGLKTHQAGNVFVLPVVAGFLGADTIAYLISEQPHKQDEMMLLIDIGTNGEMVLGNKWQLVATSCATGPAFEGAQITHGMRAAEGAMEKIEIDPETWEVRYKVIGKEQWSDEVPTDYLQPQGICGSAIIDLSWELYKSGIINSSGNFN